MDYGGTEDQIIEVKQKSNKCTVFVSLFSILNFIFLCIIMTKINYIDREANKFFQNSKSAYDRMNAIDFNSLETSLSTLNSAATLNSITTLSTSPSNTIEFYSNLNGLLQSFERNITLLGTNGRNEPAMYYS